MYRAIILTIIAFCLFAGSAFAAVPQFINYQGLLQDTTGVPVADGPHLIKFIIWNDPVATTAANEKWNSNFQSINVSDGLFEYQLGSIVPLPAGLFSNNTSLYLGVTEGVNPEMLPRTKLVSVGYAFHALDADTAQFATNAGSASNVSQIGTQVTNFVPKWDGFALVSGTIYDNGNVGIGTSAPSEKLEVAGVISSTTGGFKFPDATIQTSAAASSPPGAVVYTRWGRKTCPSGSSLIYEGFAASGNYLHAGGATNTICLTNSPNYNEFNAGNQNGNLIWGTEYMTAGYGIASFVALNNFEAPCAVCLRDTARVVIMLPGTQACPSGWNLEYAGYLMANHYTQTGAESVCVDLAAEAIGNATFIGGNLWYPTEAECGSLPCPPYIQDREITCSVCSR